MQVVRPAALAALALMTWWRPAAPAEPTVEPQPRAAEAIRPYLTPTEPVPAGDHLLAALRERVKYVFVLFQENRSFDSYFGSFPGAHGLYSQPPEDTSGFVQPLIDTDGRMTSIRPFRIGQPQHAADLGDVDHSHPGMAAKMHVENGVPRMDRFALVEEMKFTRKGENPPLAAKQMGELAMAHVDCDTIPFLWDYASRFVLFDDFFQHTIGPSTPQAINIIAGQTGETQWMKHPETATRGATSAVSGGGEPVVSDIYPFWGSPDDHTSSQPSNPHHWPGVQLNQTYATLPLTLTGRALPQVAPADQDPAADLADIREDLGALAAGDRPAVPWAWYQEGYDREPTDPPDAPAEGTHLSYVTHHNGPQYFGYLANNPLMSAHLQGLNDFFRDIAMRRLPPEGGVYYVRGGYRNVAGLKPTLDDPDVQRKFLGDDDHPGYSDSEISEALVAREVNAIARSAYWAESAIVVTYDESEGDYDHVPPAILEADPNGLPLSRGPRIPLILISPYARAHAISHETGDHAMVIRFVDRLFGLTPLAELPDEAAARALGEQRFGQRFLGPADAGVPGQGDLLSGFDPARVFGRAPPLPADYAEIPDAVVNTLPHYGGHGCAAIGMEPEDVARGIANP
ncbi:MAG: phosphoesterase, partial [Alphaproteobacteria bacterium]|nr:phosphoesterase [Alphaproteobacteria bacterium]